MSLATRCPHCATVFRVQPSQLSARGGKVRCGKCSQVFDGVTSLVAQSPEGDENTGGEASPQLALFEAPREPANPPAQVDSKAEPAAPPPAFLDESPPPPARRVWVLGAVLSLLVLAVQAALHFRTEFAVLLPEARPQLLALCAAAGCEVRLPRRPKLMAIESSDLQAEGRRENVIVVNAVLRNQAPFAQEYPALELTLTDDKDEALARRVLRPADYLGPAAASRLAQGIGPGADAALRLHLDTGGLKAVGYRMYLFFP